MHILDWVWSDIYTRIDTHTHTHTHTYIYIYIYIWSSPFFFFFFGCDAWGFVLHWWLNGGVAHVVATCSTSIDWEASFLVEIFSVFPHFSRQRAFWSLSFLFALPSSCYFLTFLVRVVSPTSQVAHFALSLLSFLLIFRYAPYLSFFPFWFFCLLSSFSLFFSAFPFAK